jgi:hypothetical protein
VQLQVSAALSGPNVQCSYATEFDFEEQHWMVLIRANQFNAISEWVMNVTASNAGDVVGLLGGDACCGNRCEQSVVVPAAQRGMRFLCRTKILFNSKVYLHGTALEPATPTLC